MAEKEMTEDEKKLELRRDWGEFYDTKLVQAIVEREGNPHDGASDDKVKQFSAGIVSQDSEYKKMIELRKRHSNDLITPPIDAVLELAKLVESGVDADKNLKSTYTLIDEANKKIEKVFVGEKLLKQNLKKAWDTFTTTHLNKFLTIMDDGTLENFKDNIDPLLYGTTPFLLLDEEFCNYSETKKESIVKDVIHLILSAVNMYKDIETDEKKKMLYDKIKEINDSKKLVDKALGPGWKFKDKSPDPILTGPQYITIKGNKYSVVADATNNGSHEMIYNEGTKCWKENVSGGATKSKKKRGPKSRPKSSTKSREKSRRY